MEDVLPANQDLFRIERDDSDQDESDEEYEARVSARLPNFPPSVICDWLVRHERNAFRIHGWLDYRRFKFELLTKPLEFFESVATSNDEAVADWSLMILTEPDFRNYHLGKFMIENGTWPVPPIILDNYEGLVPPSSRWLGRFHLLEGHHRLSYVRGLQNDPTVRLLPEHQCWLVRCEHV